MSNGLSSPDIALGIPPPEIKAPEKNFTPLPRFSERQPDMESPNFKEPTTTNDPDVNQLMADILTQGQQKKPQEAVKQVAKNIPVEAKKSLIAKIIEWFSNLPIINWFFRKK